MPTSAEDKSNIGNVGAIEKKINPTSVSDIPTVNE
jgi:hypothetical protein